ncbi:MAG TPA: CorA family divalent cation transporter [Nitrospira sp.]
MNFIAWIYSMNVEQMPEPKSRRDSPIVLAVMVLVGAGMLIMFRRKRWL